MEKKRISRKEIEGVVLSDKMQKTIVVKVQRFSKDHRYGRVIKRIIKFKAHDEKNEAKIGDKVLISSTKPLSKDKRWRLVKIIK